MDMYLGKVQRLLLFLSCCHFFPQQFIVCLCRTRGATNFNEKPLFRCSQHFGCQRNDLHEIALTQLASDGTKDTGSARIIPGGDDHRSVLVETNVRAVRARILLGNAHDDGVDHLAFLHLTVRRSLLDRGLDDIADLGIALARTAHHADTHNLFRAGVIGDFQTRLWLNHGSPPLFFRRLGAQIWINLGQNLLNRHNAAPQLQYLDQLPAFQLAQRAGFADAYRVANLTDVLFVMRVKMFRLFIGAFVDAMLLERDDRDDDRLLHLIADYDADLLLYARSALLRSRGSSLLCHYSCSSNCLSRCSTRAISLRVCVNARLFLISPRCCCRRRLNNFRRSSLSSRWASPSLKPMICLRRSLTFNALCLPSN